MNLSAALDGHEVIPDTVDVLVICALKEEYDQVLCVTDGLIQPGWNEHPVPAGWVVADGRFDTASGIPVSVRVTWVTHMGREQAQAAASTLINQQPARCIAMTGLCAGRRGQVGLGDVIFADRLYSYDAGKVVVEDGQPRFQGDMLQYRPPLVWLQRMQRLVIPRSASWLSGRPKLPLENQEDWVLLRYYAREEPRHHIDFRAACPDWADVFPRLLKRKWVVWKFHWRDLILWMSRGKPLERKPTLTSAGRLRAQELALLHSGTVPAPADFRAKVAPMATGATVTEDDGIFPRLAISMRKVLAVDMEASALGALGEHHGVPVLVAKGVSDYGDAFKDDRYRRFAARAGAECLIALLREASDLLRGQNAVATRLDDKITAELAALSEVVSAATPTDILDRFIEASVDKALKRRYFGEAKPIQELLDFAIRADGKDLSKASLAPRVRLFRETAAAYARADDLPSAMAWLSKARALDPSGNFTCDDARLLICHQKVDDALRLLRDDKSPEARGLMLDAVAKKDGLEGAIAYADVEHLGAETLTAGGLLGLACKAAELKRHEHAEALLSTATQQQIEQCPAILSIRAEIRVVLCWPESDRIGISIGTPLHPKLVKFSDEPKLIEMRMAALQDIDLFLSRYVPQLDLRLYSHHLEEVALLLRLAHPDKSVRIEAYEWLKSEAQEISKAVRWARFAFDYGVNLNLQALRDYLGVRKQTGGWTHSETITALLVALQGDYTDQLLSLIQENRATLLEVFEPRMLSAIEVEVLARTGDIAAAEALLTSLTAEYGADGTETLRNLVQEISGGDALALRLRSLEKTGGAGERRFVIDELLAKHLPSDAADHLTVLFGQVPNVRDALQIAQCHIEAGNYAGLRTFFARDDVRSIIPLSQDLQSFEAWSAYFSGDLNEATALLAPLLKARDDENDRRLARNLLVESGNWEALNGLLSEDVKRKEHLAAAELLSAAATGRVTGLTQQQIEELIDAAGAKSMQSGDASMLAAAWQALVSLGVENQRTDAAIWLKRAIELSGPEGPISARPISDLLELTKRSEEKNKRVNTLVTAGDAPLAIAAEPLNATLTDIIAGNFLRNCGFDDPRIKVGLPLFAGNRMFRPLDKVRTLALDRSALMIFGCLAACRTFVSRNLDYTGLH